jgi:hypothetical protein
VAIVRNGRVEREMGGERVVREELDGEREEEEEEKKRREEGRPGGKKNGEPKWP